MNKILLSAFWAVWPMAWHQLQQQVAAAMSRIQAGPVDDAQRLGLPIQRQGNTAVISLNGPIVKNPGVLTRFFGFASARQTQRALEAAAEDADIETIVMNIDSPGGSVDGLAELTDTVAAVVAEKPVVAQVDGMAASAAFAVASQATRIVAGRMDLVGSIGTRMLLFDFSKMFENEGVKAIPIDTGEFKSAGALGTEITDEQIADFQRIVDGFYDDFVQTVMNGRGMTEDQVRAVGDGRIFFADEAIQLGLIDGIQTIEATMQQAVESRRRDGRGTHALRREVAVRERQTQI